MIRRELPLILLALLCALLTIALATVAMRGPAIRLTCEIEERRA